MSRVQLWNCTNSGESADSARIATVSAVPKFAEAEAESGA